LIFDNVCLRCRLRLTNARRFLAYMSSRALATTTTCSYFWGRKINLSGISPAKGWQRSGNFGRDRPILGKMGAGTNSAEPEFLCVVIQRIFRQLRNGRFSPNLVTKRSSVSRRGIWKVVFETFHFRNHLPPKYEIENRSNRHLTQSRP